MRLRGFLAALAAVLLLFAPASAHTREEVRAQYAKISDWSAGNLYLSEPSVSAPYAAGEVRPEALSDALDYLNFLRWLAGLEEVELDSALTGIAQYGAVLTAANGFVSHEPPAPADMDAAFYDKALYAAGTCNIVSLNWTSEDVLRQGLAYFARDDGEQNLSTLGHRRWLFNPVMGYTGFGLAGDANGASYITMYAHDLQGEPGAWEYVAWPSAGAFPAELMSAELAWSIVLNPEIYDTDGAWACLIFRPEVEEDYEQNQRWLVEAGTGAGAAISYVVEMISLYPVEPASVEISPRQTQMRVGETLALTAAVVPDWADDLSVAWSSSDESVATVENGVVTAVGAGSCEIRATAVNGKADACALTVLG